MEELVEKVKIKEHKKRKITVWRFLAYFIIYSVLGWVIETTFAFLMYGVIESRQSFLYGPFCAIYGVGASMMLVFLQFFDKNNYTLFFAGCIIGSIVEYIVSWIGELLLDTRWWDYSGQFLNINGRICLTYTVFWGVLAIFLMKTINPKIDDLINWIHRKASPKILKVTVTVITLLMFIDCLYSAAAEEWVLTKVSVEKNLEIENKDIVKEKYDNVYSDKQKKEFVDKYWTVEHVLFSYPNLTKKLSDGKRVYIKKLYPEIHPYLIKIKPEKEGTIYEP